MKLTSRVIRPLAAALALAPFAPAGGQTIGVNAGATGSAAIAPNGKLTVPIIIDLSSAGGVNIAGLQASMSWSAARLTLDSIRAVPVAGWSFIANTAGAPSGTSVFNAFGVNALAATSTIANAYFTASPTAGGTRVMLAVPAAANVSSASILSAIRPRALDVCVGTTAKWGDVNDDGVVNIADAQQIARFAVGLSVTNLTVLLQRGDVTADGNINISDAQQVARFSVGLPASPRINTDLATAPATTSVAMSPAGAQLLVVGSSRQMEATPSAGAIDLTGCALVSWSSSNPAVATVNSSGFVSAISAGNATITATSGAFNAQSAFTVTNVPVASVSVALAPTAIQIGTNSTATATTRDAANNVLAGRVVTFTSSNTSVATVNATTGVVTGVAAGTATIFATSEGITGSAVVTVTTGIPTASVTVSLGQPTLNVGQTTQGTAVARDAGNNVLGGKTFTWSSSNTGVATVNPGTGLVTAVAGGSANIIATSDGVSGQTTVNVNVEPVASVTIAFGSATIAAGATTQATATTRSATNNLLTGRVVTFTSSNTAVATVGAVNGIVTGVAAGTATIFATSEGVTGQADITITSGSTVASVAIALGSSVIQVGSTTPAVATLRDAANNIVSAPVVWSSSAPSVASVNGSTGVITGMAAGQATIVGTSGGVTGQANLTVNITPVASVTVSLDPASIVIGGTSAATARTFDADGNELFGRSVAWASTSTSRATVNSSGLVTGVSTGTATIRATVEGRIGSATITVSNVAVASVSVALGSSSIPVGGTTTATATVRDASNNVLTGRTVTWSSGSTSRATVNSSGTVTGVSSGSANIIATVEGVTGQASVSVSNAAVASVAVSLSAQTIGVGGSATASAVLRDAAGNIITRPVTFTSSNTTTATVNATTGAITGVSLGTANIVATSEGISNQLTITIAAVTSNEPAGMTMIAERLFNCVKPTACESDWFYSERYPGAATLASEPEAPRSSSNVVQMNFTPELPAGTGPASIGRGLGLRPRILYTTMWFRVSPNFVGHGTQTNKVVHLFIANLNRAYFMARGSGSNPLRPAFGLQQLSAPYTHVNESGNTVTTSSANLIPNVNQVTLQRGVWYRIEWVLTGNTPGQPDGRVELWVNGVKALDYQGIQFVGATSPTTWEEWKWNPTWGGLGGTITESFFMQVDHVYISGKN